MAQKLILFRNLKLIFVIEMKENPKLRKKKVFSDTWINRYVLTQSPILFVILVIDWNLNLGAHGTSLTSALNAIICEKNNQKLHFLTSKVIVVYYLFHPQGNSLLEAQNPYDLKNCVQFSEQTFLSSPICGTLPLDVVAKLKNLPLKNRKERVESDIKRGKKR